MNGETITGAAIGGLAGTVLGPAGTVAFGALGGLVGDAYSRKPSVGTFATTMRNDLKPENVTLNAHEIYVRITTGPGAGTLVAACAAATNLAKAFSDRATQIATLRGATAAAWQGDASAAAIAATGPLADTFTVAQRQLAANSQALTAEAEAFDHIRSQVEFVPETPPQSGIANAVNPFQTDVDGAITAYNAKAAKNVALYEAYSADTAAARSQVPQSYPEPGPLSASAAAVTRTGSPVQAASSTPPQLGVTAGAGGEPAATTASAAPGGAASAPPSTGAAAGKSDGTAGQGAGSTGRPVQQPPSTTTPAATVPALPAAGDAYAGGPLAGVPRTGAEVQRTRYGAGPGVGSFTGGAAPRPAAVPGARAGGPSVGTGPIPGQSSAAGRGGVAGAAVRGANGMHGMPASPAGRAGGEEDQEHRRKYLIEPDGKDLFGEPEACVPPVIGDNR